MKSNIKSKLVLNEDEELYNKPGEIILTVGMIVKNEERHLENCLSALKKLLDNIPGELIIVDTGSTDRSKEIALKYTDKVYDFEWCDDFAAARNYGLKKAKGKWFMFVDADEYLDDNCEEMIKFFSVPKLWKKYNSASIPLLNYCYGKKKPFDQFFAPRLVKLSEDVEFHDAIHEWLPQPLPHGYFSTNLHHYGYAYENKEQREKKAERNMKLLIEEYKKNPTDVRTLSHIVASSFGDKEYGSFEKREKFFLEYYNEALKNLDKTYGVAVYPDIIAFYMSSDKFNEAEKYIDEYLNNKEFKNLISTVSIYRLGVMLYLSDTVARNYDKAYEYLKKYFEYYQKYKNDELNLTILRSCSLRGLTDLDYEEQCINMAKCAYNLKKYDEALEALDKVDLDDMTFEHLKMFLNVIRDLVERSKEYSHIATIYKNILSFNDKDKTKFVLYLMQQYYLEHFSEREDFMNAVIESGVEGKYVDLMKLVKADEDKKDISAEIQEFVDSIEDWNDGYAVALYLAMKHNADLSVAIDRMSHKQIRDNLHVINDGYYEYSKTALEYFNIDNFSDSIKKLYFMVTALEFAAEGAITLSYDDRGVLFDMFVCTLSDYIMNIYNPELLNPEDVEVLPELHRFGYYMTLAFTAQNEGNDIAYIRSLKEALRLCESMKELVSYYLKEFERKLKNE